MKSVFFLQYSPVLKKLFVDKDKACPVMFKLSSEPPPGSYIRAMPIFKKPEYIQEPVRRCSNHAGPPSGQNINLSSLDISIVKGVYFIKTLCKLCESLLFLVSGHVASDLWNDV